ncbi:YadA-like family protein [uncultured Veillonella sp.]|uniref:YadA-like family protein n=1 Tax=uncultured Veillonella sp. TaxID=159268 RepID=UPI0028D53ED1|nr:YadA-like family protein [uncultured Veillonella sp.]
MNKTVLMTVTIASLAANVMAANNNTLVGTDNNITATSHSSLVSGYQNTIDANNALAFGTNNTVTGENGFVGGNNATAAGRNSFAFGSHAESLVEYTVAIGNQARTASYDSVAIGNGAFVSGESSVAFGRTNNVTGENSVAIGANNGTVAGGQSAVVGYNNKIGADKEQLVFGSNSESSGQGALVFGTHSKAVAMDAVAFGNNTIADKSNAVAIGTNSVTDDAVGVEGITINGTKHVFAGEQPASVVSFGAKARAGAGGVTQYNRQLTNVSAGQISADSLDAVNGSQLFAAIDEIETNAKQINKNKQNIKDVAIGLNMLGDVVNDHEQAIAGNTTAITNNTNRINGNTNAINSLGQNVATNTADIRVLEKVADNHEGRITDLEHRSTSMANDINNKVNNLGQRVNKLGASSAALAGLHPLEYNKNDKGSFAISYGRYRNANAIALGAFYSPNEKVRLGFGITLGGETQFNINAAFRTGRGSEYEPQAKNGELEQLRQEVETLKALVNK